MRVGCAGTAIAAAGALLALGYACTSWWLSADLVRFPARSAAEVLAEDGLRGPADVGLPLPADVEVPAEGAVVSAWLFRHPAPAGCGVVLSHGHRATRHQVLKFAPLFWARGCHLLLPDARHNGASSGAYFTWGDRERRDVLRSVDALVEATGIPRRSVGLFGVSMGAAVSLQAAALEPRLAFVVADSSFSDMPSVVRGRAIKTRGRLAALLVPGALAAAGLRAGFDPWAMSPADAAEAIQVPVLLVHSRTDDWFPPSDSEAILVRVPHSRKALVVTDWGAEHGRSISVHPEAYARLVSDFLDAQVPEGAPIRCQPR